MPLYLVSKPTVDVLSLADAKRHLNIDFDDKDDDVQAYLDAAIAKVDGHFGVLNRALVDQTWDLKLDFFPTYCDTDRWGHYVRQIKLPLPPLLEVESVKYIDVNGVEQTMDTAAYRVSGVGGRGYISLASGQSWPSIACAWPEAVAIRFRAGFIDMQSPPVGTVPPPIISAIKLILGHLWANRESVVVGQSQIALPLPQGAEWLLQPYVVIE